MFVETGGEEYSTPTFPDRDKTWRKNKAGRNSDFGSRILHFNLSSVYHEFIII